MMQNQQYSHSKFFSSNSIEKAISDLFREQNVTVYNQSATEMAILCPFHDNKHTPSLYINTKTGLWQCFNPSCGSKGNFRQIYKSLTGKAYSREWGLDPVNLQRQLDMALIEYGEDSICIDSIRVDYESDEAKLLQPFVDRGFSIDTLRYFEVGYSQLKNRIAIPVRDAQFKLVGIIGRAVLENQEPKYLYNKGFKRGDILFNIQNAKSYDEVIVCEGSLDAFKTHQSGLNNVVATLGAKVTPNQIKLLRKYFDSIIIFSDQDSAGDSMMSGIISGCRGKEIYRMKVPEDYKDPGEMTEEQILNSFTKKQIITGE
jgi:DNA primase